MPLVYSDIRETEISNLAIHSINQFSLMILCRTEGNQTNCMVQENHIITTLMVTIHYIDKPD